MANRAKVECILIKEQPTDGTGTMPPYGYYHIIKVYNLERGDQWPIAYLDTNEGLEFAGAISKMLAKRHNCDVKISC